MAIQTIRSDDMNKLCPYVVGATFHLEITAPVGSTLQVQARVIGLFEPFSMAPIMRVALEDTSPTDATSTPVTLPKEAVLKVYDHRFALSARNEWEIGLLTPEREAEYTAYANGPDAARNLGELFGVGMELESDNPDDYCPDHLAFEHMTALTVTSDFDSEHNTYKRLSSLQGKDIPIFYGTTRFLGGQAVPNLNLTKPGILIQYIEGTNLDSIEPEQVNIDLIGKECLRIITEYGRLGIKNHAVRLNNFIVKPDGSGAVLIDFGNCEMRGNSTSDDEWNEDKRVFDEEGDFQFRARRKWGWKLKPEGAAAEQLGDRLWEGNGGQTEAKLATSSQIHVL